MLDAFDNLKLCSYLFVADSFDNGEKIINSFVPLIESILIQSETKTNISFLALQNSINEIYKLYIQK